MQINKITFTPSVNRQINNNNNNNNNNQINKQNEPLTYTNNTISNYAYRDYNISFGDRLFRTPANFFAQPFNKNNMPDTMKEYLNADYSDRQNMPPAQMLRLVFDDLNEIKSLDFVPRIFPNEPLFKDLTDTPRINARTGLLSEIIAMKSEMDEQPLFKDGTSNLGMYILKKIYLEGKTVSEINKDFKKDISEAYKDLITSEIDHTTTSAYGIKFPKRPFWKSFVATREDFPYEYKPRKNKNGESVNKDGKSIASLNERYRNEEDRRPPKFKTDKDFDKRGQRMGDALIDAHGDSGKVEKAMHHKGIRDKEEISFVAKYLGPIMSIALEKIHASEEMRDYFERYDTLTKKQRQRMEGYWKHNPFMREYQSLAISDTIKLFYEAYGADGNNDEFRDLLEYAAQIKPNRKLRDDAHQRKQLELEETFANFKENETTEETNTEAPAIPKADLTEEELAALAEQEAIKNGAKIYEFSLEDGRVYRVVANIDELIKEKMKKDLSILPSKFINRYTTHLLNSPLATEEYKKATALRGSVPSNIESQLMSIEEIIKISDELGKNFGKKNTKYVLAEEDAFAERIISRLGDNYSFILQYDARYLMALARAKGIKDWTASERILLDKSFDEYVRPVTNKEEAKEIADKMLYYLTTTEPSSKGWKDKNFKEPDEIYALTSAVIKKYPKLKNNLEKLIRRTHFIENYGGTSRMLLNKDVSERTKLTKSKLMLNQLTAQYSDDMLRLMTKDKNLIEWYVNTPELKFNLLSAHYNNN